MAGYRCVSLLALLACAAAVEVTPLEKVIALIDGLKKEVEDEGKAEASTYEKFACFCKDSTKTKSDSIIKGTDKINVLSADIADKTQKKRDDSTELGERKANHEKLSKELDDTKARCAKERAAYEAEAADLSKAISSLRSATKAMKDSKPAALLSIKSVVKTLSASTVMTRTSASMQKKVASMLQQKVDPSDPAFSFHSNDIIELCENLLVDFKGQKSDLDSEWDKTNKACVETKKSLKEEMKTNQEAMDNLEKEIEKLLKEVAKHREDLVQSQSDLTDDEAYLKDMTGRCEDRANDYDQRSQMRNQELGALTSALKILSGDVADADGVNKRAMFMQSPPAAKAPKQKGAVGAKAPASVAPKVQPKKKTAAKSTVKVAEKSVSFLQAALVKAHSSNFLVQHADASLELEAKKNRALATLRSEGQRIVSVTISSLVARVAADPFQKVKGLIQKLVERLLEESAAEATKKGFCDEALGKAEHDRDARFQDSNDLNREIASLEAKEDELSEEITVLTKDIKTEKADLKKATEDRDKEKSDNLEAVSVAKDGFAAVTEALQLLKSFYASAAKASASLIQASPVDEDAPEVASGSYQGKQGGMKAVFALLETIQSDFDRTLRNTEASEAAAHRSYVKFMQGSTSSIAAKSTKKELDEQDLKSTRTSIKKSMADLESNVDLLDDALKELETLKPTCMDTGMSYKERVEKREQEMEALKNALCMLDAERVEAECKNGPLM